MFKQPPCFSTLDLYALGASHRSRHRYEHAQSACRHTDSAPNHARESTGVAAGAGKGGRGDDTAAIDAGQRELCQSVPVHGTRGAV